MPSYRIQRLSEDVMRELSALMRELKDPRVSGKMLSIVKLELSGDLSYCKVYVSSMEGIEATRQAVKGLTAAGGFIRHEIGQRIKMRKSPEFRFVADDSIEHSAKIAGMIERLEEEENGKQS